MLFDHEIATIEEAASEFGWYRDIRRELLAIAKRAREHREKDAEQRRMEELSARLNWGEVIG
jgi:hypothetical protein